MARRRFFVPEVRNNQTELEGDDARHLTQVLRVEAGQIYEISDNRNVYLAEVTLARKAHIVFRVMEQLPPPETPVPLTVLVALIKFERLETIFEKATELGATEIRLVRAERSEKGLDLAAPKRMHRWQRIALEASQQSRRAALPQISGPFPFARALEFQSEHRLLLDEDRTGGSIVDHVKSQAPAAILAGPEGGWTAQERKQALDAGWTPVWRWAICRRSSSA